MHIALASDDNYARHLGVSLYSILENNKDSDITIHVLDSGISNKNNINIKNIVNQFNQKIIFYNLNDYNKVFDNINMTASSIATYSRVFLTSILSKDIEKVMYLDVDSVVCGSLKEVWNLDLEENLIAGVEDLVPIKFKNIIGLGKENTYVNAGFLVINLKQWRREKLESSIVEFIMNNDGKSTHYDQGAINAICKDRVKVLHPMYNVLTPFYIIKYKKLFKIYNLDKYYSEEEIKEATENPVFIHYVPAFVSRPWVKGCKHPESSRYLNYLNKTVWKNDGLEEDNRSIKIKFASYICRYL